MGKTIHELGTLSTVTANDQVVVYGVSSSVTGKASLEDIITVGGAVMSHDDTAAFVGNTGPEQNLFFLQSTLNSTNTTYGGDRAGLIIKPDGLQVYDDTKTSTLWNLTIPVSIANGGTGQTSAANARTALAVPSTAQVWLTSTSHTANAVLAAPNGSAGTAGFRTLVAADIPNIGAGKITSGTLATGVLPTVPIAKGGTGATDRLTAFKNITNQNVGSAAQYFVSLTNNWATAGYSSKADTKTALGMKCTQLYSGTFKSGSTTFSSGYEFFIIFGTAGGGARESVVVPKATMGSSDMTVLISDESCYLSVKVKYSGATATMTFDANKNASGATMTAGSILRIYGVLTQ